MMEAYRKTEPTTGGELDLAYRVTAPKGVLSVGAILLQQITNLMDINKRSKIVIDYDPEAANFEVRLFQDGASDHEEKALFDGLIVMENITNGTIRIGFQDTEAHFGEISKDEALKFANRLRTLVAKM